MSNEFIFDNDFWYFSLYNDLKWNDQYEISRYNLQLEGQTPTIKQLFSKALMTGLPDPSYKLDFEKKIEACIIEKIALMNKQKTGYVHQYKSHTVELKAVGSNGVIRVPALRNYLGINFQNEAITELSKGNLEQYKKFYDIADKMYQNRKLIDILKYSVEGVPNSRSAFLKLNELVRNFQIYNRNDKQVLWVKYSKNDHESYIPLEPTKMSKEERRAALDEIARQNMLKRAVTRLK